MNNRKKLVRITTIPLSLDKLLEYQLRFMQQYYDVTAVADDEDELEKIGEKEQVRVFPVHLTRLITPWKDLKAVGKLYRFFKKEKPLIVHTHTPKAGTVGMIAAKLAGVPIRLHTVAGLPLLEVTGKKRKLLNLVEKITYAAATKVYPNSNGLKEIIIQQRFCKPEKLKVIANGSSNGINTAYFDPAIGSDAEKSALKEKLGISQNDFVFVFVGRMVGDKGINELVNAFQRLSADHKNSKLLLVGPLEPELDPLLPATETIIKENPRIITTGYQSDVRPYFSISHALAFPSYREGFPNVVMQAGAMGLPSIVSDINGCNEIIVNEENGIIVPVKDENALVEAMKALIENKALYAKLKVNARKMITERFEQKVVWEAILEEYRRLESGMRDEG